MLRRQGAPAPPAPKFLVHPDRGGGHALHVLSLIHISFGILYWLDDLGDGCLQRDVCVASGLTKQTVNSSVHKRCV